MSKVVLVISSLTMGGAESVLAWLAGGLADRGHAVTVLTMDDGSAPPHYPLPEAVRHRALGLAGRTGNVVTALFANIGRVRGLRRAILAEAPDVVISFMEQTNVLVLLAVGKALPVIVSERVHPMHPVGRVWDTLRKRIYPRAARLVVQTASIAREFDWLAQDKVAVVPNAALAVAAGEPTHRMEGPVVVAMGRLHRQKGFDLLLEGFVRLGDEFSEWRLVIFGEGPERETLETMVRDLGLKGRVSFPGRTPTPHADLAQGEIFAFPSRFEGFPNALCEAMACGLACVAARCPGGPADLITHGRDGLLVDVDDVDGLVEALAGLMADEGRRGELGAKATHIARRYAPEAVLDQWEGLVEQAAHGS